MSDTHAVTDRAAYIRERLALGHTYQAIGDDLGVSRQRVHQISRASGIAALPERQKPPGRFYPPHVIAAVRRLWDAGRPNAAISAVMTRILHRRFSVAQVKAIASRNHFPPRSRTAQ